MQVKVARGVGCSQKELRQKIAEAHRRAVARSLAHAFPELRSRRVVVFVEGDDITESAENSEIISAALSEASGAQVRKATLRNLAKEYRKGAKELQIHPLLLEILLRGEGGLAVLLKAAEEFMKQVSGGAGAEAFGVAKVGVVGKAGENSRVSAEVGATLKQLQDVVVSDFMDAVVEKSKKEGILLVEYSPGFSQAVMNELVKRATSARSLYVFVDKALYAVADVPGLVSASGVAVLASDSLSRYRKLALSYLAFLRDECLKRRFVPRIRGRDDVRDFGTFLDYMIRMKFDVLLAHAVLVYVDSAPGVAFKVLRDVALSMYTMLKEETATYCGKELPAGEVLRKAWSSRTKRLALWKLFAYLLAKSLRKAVARYVAYSVETGKEAYERYVEMLRGLSGVRRESVLKILYVLSVCARIQRQRGKVMLLSDTTVLQYAKRMLTPEEMAELRKKMPALLEAMSKAGFINSTPYLSSYIIAIQRPLLLDTYAKYAEMEMPELRAVKLKVVADILSTVNARMLPTEKVVEEMVEAVFGSEAEKKLVKHKVLIDRALLMYARPARAISRYGKAIS